MKVGILRSLKSILNEAAIGFHITLGVYKEDAKASLACTALYPPAISVTTDDQKAPCLGRKRHGRHDFVKSPHIVFGQADLAAKTVKVVRNDRTDD